MIINISTLEQLNSTDLDQLQSKDLIRKFGQNNDSIELTIFDLNGKVLINDEQFTDYTYYDNGEGLFNSIDIDFEQVLKDYGFRNGKYRLIFSFQRKILTTGLRKQFLITEVSPTRTEIRFKSNTLNDTSFNNATQNLIGILRNSPYFKDLNISFGQGITGLITNAQKDKNTCLIKLYDPLPPRIGVNSRFRVYEDIINPLEVEVDLGESVILDSGIALKGPNFEIEYNDDLSVSSEFRTYDSILSNGAITSSFNNLQNYLSGSIYIDLEFDNPNTPSGYTFENFIHFSSATERLKNFRYKLSLLESYSASLADLGNITGSISESKPAVENIRIFNEKTDKVIQGFDYYERYLYFESGAYAWPKTTSGNYPHINAKVDSIPAISWFGAPSNDLNSAYYGGQMLSASLFDECNRHNLVRTIPPDIRDNPQNEAYVLFTEMIGQHFDSIWAHIDSITDKYQAHSGINDGVSKELVFEALREKGIRAYSQFENSDIYEYFLGDDGTGTFQYTSTDGSTMISASNAGSLPKGDISKEIWKRLYHNSPYLLKTKGTERGLKALIASYGIPESVLHVKEYGGPLVDKTSFRTFSYQKESRMVSNAGTSATDAIVLINDGFRNPNYTGKTYQVRYLPDQNSDDHPNQCIFSFIQSTPAENDLGVLISQSFDHTIKDSGSFAHLVLVTGSTAENIQTGNVHKVASAKVPFFNGKPWNISLTIDSGSSNEIIAYATQTTFNKNTYVASCSIDGTSYLDNVLAIDNNFPRVLVVPVSFPISYQAPVVGGVTASIQEFRVYEELLTKSTIVSQSLSPFNYNGNTISSSYESLICRLPLGSDLFTTSSGTSYLLNKQPNPNFNSFVEFNTSQRRVKPGKFISIEETHHLTTPDTVGSAMVSDKVRIDNGTFDDNFLDPFISVETSPQDRQPLDYSDLGIFFSPTFEINEDIIYTLGGFRLDDYIGDPKHFTSGSYPDLKTIRDVYTQKVEKRYNFQDYIRTIQFFDHTLFKMIKDFVPAKANLKTGLVIEPHYLERAKIAGTNIDYEELTVHQANYVTTASVSSTNETERDVVINAHDYILSGSNATAVENVAQTGRPSQFYTY